MNFINCYKKLFLSLIACLTIYSQSIASDYLAKYSVTTIDNRDNLPHTEIKRIIQDREGFMWFASPNGLFRYDGYDFVTYNSNSPHSNKLHSNHIRSIADSDDRIWIGTEKGLNYIDKKTQTLQRISHSILSNIVIYKIVPVGSVIWLATDIGLYKYDKITDELTLCKFLENGGAYDVKDVYLDSKQQLWVAIKSEGLFQYNYKDNIFTHYKIGEVVDIAHVIYEDYDNNIWVGSWSYGLTLIIDSKDIDNIKYKTFKIDKNDSSSISSDIIYSMSQDKQDKLLWISHMNGLSLLQHPFEEGNFINYKFDGVQNILSNNEISDVYCSNDGTMWLGTMGGGINKLNMQLSTLNYNPLKDVSKKLNSRFITAALLDANDLLWLGIKYKGLIIYDRVNDTYKHSSEISALNGIPNSIRIKSIHLAMGGKEVWVGVFGMGFYRIFLDDNHNPSGYKFYANNNEKLIDNPTVNRIFTDSKSRIWLGTYSGVSVLSSSGQIIAKDSLYSPNGNTEVQSIREDKDGNIWIGSQYNGIYKVKLIDDKLHKEHYNKENDKINNNNILSILIDSNNDIWTGSKGGGLSRFDRLTNRFESMNNLYKIPFDEIFNLFQDENQTLWMCSNKSVIHITERNEAAIYASPRLWDNIFNQECEVITLGGGNYLIGGMNGYNILNPKSLKIDNQVPSLAIIDIDVNGVSIFNSTTYEDVGHKYRGSSLTLKHTHNNCAIEFVAHNYANHGHTNYAYRLVGHNDKWIYVTGTQRRVNFTNLDTGNYTFELIASIENGIWSKQPKSIYITVDPSPFQTWFAYMIYIILIATLIFITYILIIHRIKLHQRVKIAEIEKNNIEELNHSKLMFYTNISHELLTPLTIIKCVADDMKIAENNSPSSIITITNNVNRLVNLIKQMLEFRKAENCKLKLHVTNGDIAAFIKSICETNFRPLVGQKQIKLTINSDTQPINGWFDADKIDKIIYNLLSNAVKYNYDNSFISVNIGQEFIDGNRCAIISVKDGGVGVDPQNIDHIFDRFYTDATRKKGVFSGNGIGLSLTKSLVEIHKGSIKVESIPGKGSNFIISIPLDVDAYLANQIYENYTEDVNTQVFNIDSLVKKDKTILIVEDNDELRAIMSEYLSKVYTVHCAENGMVAIDLLKKITVDLIVSDITMPVKDGIELCKFVKSNIEYSHIPFILLTVKNSEDDMLLSYENGADAFITKPFKLELLIVRIDNLIKGRELVKRDFEQSEDYLKSNNITYTSLDEKLLQKAIDTVEANISNEDFYFDSFATEMNVSKSMLYRKIKVLTGMTTSDFIKDIRMKFACKLLKDKPVSIAEVAYAVGFSQPKYFTVCFHKKYGLTPSEYITKHKS